MSRKPKFNPELLKEELNRFKLLENYNFYTGKQELPEYDELILGDRHLEEEDESPEQSADDISKELGLDTPPSDDNSGDTPQTDAPEDDNTSGDMGGDDSLDFGSDQGGDMGDAPEVAPAPAEPSSDDVEVDVTELVKGSEEAKDAADKASHNSEMLLQKLADLEARISKMDAVSGKIEDLENEIIKRNPTPVEKLEMRSLSSYPYSQKLTDYWADKKGAYDVMGNEDEEKEEYTLTQDDIDNSYSEGDIKQSFIVKDDDYEEEDI